ncbi:MAG: anti-CBASS protein Acb1 family protein [Candidatus Thorarchaeota archaeon]|jgi:hypothetical protein
MKKGSKHSAEARAKMSEAKKAYWNSRHGNGHKYFKAGILNKTLPSSSPASVHTNARERLEFIINTVSRAALASRLKQFDGQRDIYEVLGYKINLTFDDYLARYERQDIASRIIDAPPSATWRKPPVIYEEDPLALNSPFETAWQALAQKHKVYHYLQRADKLSGIGKYGILLVGLPGTLTSPVSKVSSPDDILYLQAYTEKSAAIEKYVTDTKDERFGRVEIYKLNLSGIEEGLAAANLPRNELIHYSRVLHIAEGKVENEVHGTPRLRPVFNLLDDLVKVSGGAPEMFWQGAYRGLHVDVSPEFQMGGVLTDDSVDDLSDEIDDYIHGIRRWIRTQGVDIKPLEVQLADPTGVFNVIMDLLSGTVKIPKRILLGSERGEQASAQDEVNWNVRIIERQTQFAEPEILRPFIDQMIELGVLPEPSKGEYSVQWPSLFEKDEKTIAEVAWTVSKGLRTYVGSKGDPSEVMGPREFREKVLLVDPEKPEDDTRLESFQPDTDSNPMGVPFADRMPDSVGGKVNAESEEGRET